MQRPRRHHLALSLCLSLCLLGSLPVYPALSAAGEGSPNLLVAEMIAQVQESTITAYTGDLSGEWPVWVDAAQYTLSTRSTTSGEPIQKATQYVYDHLRTWGLSPLFDDWTRFSYSGRNVIGVLPGETTPGEIVLLTAHLDDAPWNGRAPGADDNASGSVGVLLAAEILSQYRFGRTLRFVFFTGEERGLWGSHEYAVEARELGENIVAVCNLDMIGWDALDGPVVRLHTRSAANPGIGQDTAIAQAFVDTVTDYNLNLDPLIVADGMTRSDHASFWGQGYPAILAIEDDLNDFNDYYHSTNDRLAWLNLSYFTSFIKAVTGAAAQLAGPVGKSAGPYHARLEPPASMQWGDPAEAITYPLMVTNTGSAGDTYTLAAAGNAWAMNYPAQVGPLAPGESLGLTVTVSIPADALGGAADIVDFSITSQGSGMLVDRAELTTVTHWKVLYLPLVWR